MTPATRRLMAYLEANPGRTFREVSEGAYVSTTWATKLLCALVKENIIHISGKRSTSGGSLREYSIGAGAKPAPMLTKDKRHQAKKRKDQRERSGYYETLKANRRLANPDPLLAALMGLRS